jgi:hypothetical protein
MYVYTYTPYMYMSNNRTKFLDIAISSSFYDIVIASPLKHHAIVPTNWAKPIFRCPRSGSGCGIHSFVMRVEKVGPETVLSQIVHMVAEAQRSYRGKAERHTSKNS